MYFQAKKMTKEQIAVFVAEHKWDYRQAALVLGEAENSDKVDEDSCAFLKLSLALFANNRPVAHTAQHSTGQGQKSPLTTSAIATFKRLTALRRKGIGFGGTDLGRVLDARPLSILPVYGIDKIYLAKVWVINVRALWILIAPLGFGWIGSGTRHGSESRSP
ncbi:hypothetical protein EDB86DRAFT_2828893 [Lactarius hatsudake]|nr:hypothetical protein EDB86DRAFT_2828893 [Lactarius hatsudake]